MDSKQAQIKLRIPAQNLPALSFCKATVEALSNWTQSLPMANFGESARQLYTAIRELNQLQIDSVTRYKMLEVLRPGIYSICTSLSKHFLNQSVVLPDKQLKIANLTQALQSHLATGYKIIVIKNLSSPKEAERRAKVTTFAVHRAISDLSQTILRAYQLYCHPPEFAWLELHQLYLLAESQQLLKLPVRDAQNTYLSESTVNDVYVRAILLGSSQPNQLRQKDMGLLFNATEIWAPNVKLADANNPLALFLIDLHKDSPPVYRKLMGDNISPLYRGLDTNDLVSALKMRCDNPEHKGSITVPGNLGDTLLNHLVNAWGILAERSFRRMAASGEISLCVGMSSTHYFMAGQTSFNRMLNQWNPAALSPGGSNASIGKKPLADDVWGTSFDAGSVAIPTNDAVGFGNIEFNALEEDENEDEKYPSYNVKLINTSPGGYCIEWGDTAPSTVQAGEILGLQEAGAHTWSIGVVRWIRHVKNHGTQMGVELLAPQATPCAIQLLQKTGSNGAYLRGLLMPPLKAIGQPASILTPRMPFRVGNKVHLYLNAEETKNQLTKKVTATSSYSQFHFRQLGTAITSSAPKISKDDDFDSLWQNL